MKQNKIPWKNNNFILRFLYKHRTRRRLTRIMKVFGDELYCLATEEEYKQGYITLDGRRCYTRLEEAEKALERRVW